MLSLRRHSVTALGCSYVLLASTAVRTVTNVGDSVFTRAGAGMRSTLEQNDYAVNQRNCQ